MTLIVDDKRKIKSIWWTEGSLTIGDMGITKIEAYYECGQMAEVHWFAIWKDDFLWERVNGSLIEGMEYLKEE